VQRRDASIRDVGRERQTETAVEVTMRVYSREFRVEVVRRIYAGEKISAVAKELGIHRKLLYDWRRRMNEGGESNLRERGRPHKSSTAAGTPPRITELERTIAHQQLIIEFFKRALQGFENQRQ
jgi:transposase